MTIQRRRNPAVIIFNLVVMLAAPVYAADTDRLIVADFSNGRLDGWNDKSFSGNTDYRLETGPAGQYLKASSNGSASGLFKKINVDLNKTPYLNWSWRVDNIFNGNDERTKEGDDYPARIYVIVSGSVFFWKTRALNYVWSSNQPVGSYWHNAYTDNAQMLALRSGVGQRGQWHSEKRNLLQDLKQFFGKEITEINAIALMTDSDNSQQHASAAYGDIFFSAD